MEISARPDRGMVGYSISRMNTYEGIDFSYGVYTRKSSEHEDSQVQSIQRQIDELAEVIDREQLRIHDELLKEAQSAFHPGREQFARLVQWTSQGKINAWLCWHANRLSRNPVDAGTIVYLMDQGKLHHIRTRDRIYYNTPTDKFMLQMEFTMSKKDSDDKSVLVKSGIMRRHRRGYPNGAPPAGYTYRSQDRSGHSVWVVDPERFDKVRSVLRRFLNGRDSITSITRYACAIGLTTIPKSRVGGRPLVRSAVHARLLTNPVYSGRFTGIDGKTYELDAALPRALTPYEFEKIQRMLGDRRVSTSKRKSNRVAAYRGIIHSPDGDYVGPDFKFHLVCDCKAKFSRMLRTNCPRCGKNLSTLLNPIYRDYVYYSVVKSRITPGHSTRAIEEKKIDAFVMRELARQIAISKPLRDWAVAHLEQLHDQELRERRLSARSADELRLQLDRRKERLRQLLVNGVLNEDEYKSELEKAEIEFDPEESGASRGKRGDWLEDAKKVLNLAVELGTIIARGEPAEKNQALRDLCSNLVWDGEKLSISNVKPVNGLIEALKTSKTVCPMFEPEKIVDTKGSNPVFREVRPYLLHGVDGLRTFEMGSTEDGRSPKSWDFPNFAN